tara:strand:- start:92299 stop:92628 length:330 start_codon:yes stop_codon:yes gene_type:complete
MKIPTITFREQISFLRPVWRVLLVTTFLQLAGGFLSIWIAARSDPFFDFWYGGVYATPIGLILGVFWQHLALPGSLNRNAAVLSLLAFGSAVLLMFALFGTEMGASNGS